jgi:hypothetical protein
MRGLDANDRQAATLLMCSDPVTPAGAGHQPIEWPQIGAMDDWQQLSCCSPALSLDHRPKAVGPKCLSPAGGSRPSIAIHQAR